MKFNNHSNGINSFIYSNIVSNGNFNGTTGWSASGASLSASSNILKATGSGSNSICGAQNTTSVEATTGKKIYIVCKARVTNSSSTTMHIRIDGSVSGSSSVFAQASPVQNQWYTLSGVAALSGLNGNIQIVIRHGYADAATANGKVMEVQEVMAIDLTSLFGSGKEPSAADCVNIFKFADGKKQPSISKILAS